MLPDSSENLKSFFETVVMVVASYELVAEISQFLFGFSVAKDVAEKIFINFQT
jgi:hypothetical protein